MLKYKLARSVKQRNAGYLKKLNLLRLESLRLFTSSDFTKHEFNKVCLRVQEILIMCPESLCRFHDDAKNMLMKEAKITQQAQMQYMLQYYISQVYLMSLMTFI